MGLAASISTRATKLVAALLVGGILVGLLASPATAWVEDSGYKNCGTKWVKIKSDSMGDTWHFKDETVVIAYWYVPMWDFRYSNTGETATTWAVGVSGWGLDGNDTYGYCSSSGPG